MTANSVELNELNLARLLENCAVEAGKIDANLQIIFGVTVNAIKNGKLKELGAVVGRFGIDQSLTRPMAKNL